MLAVVCFIRKQNASSATVACVTSTSVMLSKMSAGFPCRGMLRMYIIIPRSTSTASAVSSSDSSRSELTGARGEKVNSSVSGWRVRRSRRKYITANCAKGKLLGAEDVSSCLKIPSLGRIPRNGRWMCRGLIELYSV